MYIHFHPVSVLPVALAVGVVQELAWEFLDDYCLEKQFTRKLIDHYHEIK